MRILFLLLVVVFASSSSFVVHVISAEWLSVWVSNQMVNTVIEPSWNVRYVALITSIEYGIAAICLYFLAREKLIKYGKLKACLIFSVLLTAIHGAFIRQPFMDFIIGNPLQVVIVQNAFKWLVWFLMSIIVVFGYELIVKSKKC
jgi:peptidoglycan biosynthesis protein MviN/MurJ (putative lipid II flippase)